jgi:diaminopimelate decarboxylase
MTGLEALARRWGTPTYLYDIADLRRAVRDLRAALPAPSQVYFSVKANPHPDVSRTFADAGMRAEIASLGEIGPALAAGFAPDDVLMTGPGKTPDDIDAALAAGLTRFSVDSPTDLTRIGRLASAHGVDARCLLRVNADVAVPGMGLSMTGTASAFGADASWVLAEPDRFRASGRARVRGLHLYMGTNITAEEVLAQQFTTSIALATLLRDALDVPMEEIDLGGGFGMPYARAGSRPDFSGLAERITGDLDSHLPGWRQGDPEVTFESGRHLAGGCGTLLSRVVDVKVSKGRTFVVLDAGIHHLGGMSGLRRVPRIVPDLITPARAGDSVPDCSVVGPLCTPLDTWSSGVTLPPLEPGDVVGVPNVGAYGLTAGLLAFLGHPPALEVVVDGAELVSASRLDLVRARCAEPAEPSLHQTPRS